MSKLSERRQRHDQFHRRARRGGLVARSAFKLSEIDEAYNVVAPRMRVLDLGCRPGSWLQYCVQQSASVLVGVDREPLDIVVPRTRIELGNVLEFEPTTLLGDLTHFDLVLSDMAPDTTGIRHVDQARSEILFERALWLAEATLANGGHFVGKLFQGPAFQELVKRCRAAFTTVKMAKPAASRRESIEQYVVAKTFRGCISA